MTITKYDGFAFTPKRCDKCNRLFWLESYNTFIKLIIPNTDVILYKCKKCIKMGIEE